ncbi:MAG: diguanylate cyclase [Acidobacteriota bacterium]|nr:diguanylate cyclase [Acidobacteriota bacterium]
MSAKPKILIVDDEVINIKLLAEELKPLYQIAFAKNGTKALEQADQDDKPDLILLDIAMDDMDGYEVCAELKRRNRTRDIPIIFITAMDRVADEQRGLELGAVDYITKPFSLPIVKARVATHLELKRQRDLLARLSIADGLTGIPNRRYFNDSLEQEWRRAVRYQHPISLVMVDIDHFKKVNDQYGHPAGDDCLRRVAGVLAGAARRPAEFAARFGGEEFCLLMPEADLSNAMKLSEIIRERIELLEISHPPYRFKVTASFGVAGLVPERDDDPEQLVELADKNLYLAKQKGRNMVIGQETVGA